MRKVGPEVFILSQGIGFFMDFSGGDAAATLATLNREMRPAGKRMLFREPARKSAFERRPRFFLFRLNLYLS